MQLDRLISTTHTPEHVYCVDDLIEKVIHLVQVMCVCVEVSGRISRALAGVLFYWFTTFVKDSRHA